MTVEDGAVDTAAEGVDTSEASSSQDNPDVVRAHRRRDQALKRAQDSEARIKALESQLEEATASDSVKALQLAQKKAETLEKALADANGKVTAVERARKVDQIFSKVSKVVTAEEDVLALAWAGLVSQGALDDALEDGDADAALKALKKLAPSLFKEQAKGKPKDGVLLPDGPTTYDPAHALKESEDAVMRSTGRRVKNLMAGSQ